MNAHDIVGILVVGASCLGGLGSSIFMLLLGNALRRHDTTANRYHEKVDDIEIRIVKLEEWRSITGRVD